MVDYSAWYYERERLDSFNGWPVSFISPESLAAAGFYYLQDNDRVCCAFCSMELARWERGDDPREEHARHAPACRFVRNLSCGNVSLGVCSPSFPRYVDDIIRLATYKTWPVALKTRPHSLCEAGLFYTGASDATVCFQCGVGLRDWFDNDDPWVEHAKYSPQCSYVQSHDFVPSGGGSEQPDNETRLCKVCYMTEVTIVFLPCAHVVTCDTCAIKLINCPVCRRHINTTVRVYFC